MFISKSKFNTLQIWFKEFNQNYCSELRQCIRDLIQIPKEVTIDIRKFFDDENKNEFKRSNNYYNNKKEKNEKNNYYNNNSGYYGHKNDYYKNNKNKNK